MADTSLRFSSRRLPRPVRASWDASRRLAASIRWFSRKASPMRAATAISVAEASSAATVGSRVKWS